MKKRNLDLDEKAEPLSKIAKKEVFGSEKDTKESSPPKVDIRRYQQNAYEVALMRNTIVCLETGSGKTMIAVMLIKEISRHMRSRGEKHLIIFMAPTVHLVNQQTGVIKIHTDLQVEEYYGAKGVDNWNLQTWQKEIREKEVMVMTPQILLDALRNAFLTLDMVRLLIFDECHRATGNHPYAKIMLEYYHKIDHKPKVFGMTASPINKKGVSSAIDCEMQISVLEGLLDSKVLTLEDRSELEMHAPMAKEIKRYYNSWSANEQLKEKLLSLWVKFETATTPAEDPTRKQFMDKTERDLALKARLSKFHQKILYCLDNLGLFCAYEAVKVCMRKDEVANDYEESACPTSGFLLKDYLNAALDLFEGHLAPGVWTLLETEACLDPAYANLISPKLCELLSIIRGLGNQEQVLCMIFVERIVTAKVISWLIEKLKFLSHLSCTYLTGSTSAVDGLTFKKQKSIMESFREGEVNLLLTTDVAEEGIDVHNCSCVIRFDLPKSIRSYIQSRGRARQADSLYVLMLERGNEQQRDLLYEIVRSERSMWDATSTRALDACIPKLSPKDETPVYTVSSTGATITPDSSVCLIYNYCQRLPGDQYFIPRPIFSYDLYGGLYACKLTLPSNAPFQHLKGHPAKKSHYAKQLVCLDACKKLHQLGALDDHFLPVNEVLLDCNVPELEAKSAPGAGTTGRKELHGSVHANALCGTWANELNSITLQAYGLLFSCNLIEEKYPGFVLLVKEELDEDVAHAEVNLYLQNDKMVKARASPCGQVHLDMNQLKKSKAFHELFFNGLFGRLFHISKGASGERQRILVLDDKSLWTTTNMYLVLPMLQHSGQYQENPAIDWNIIDSCFSAAEILKNGCHPIIVDRGQKSQHDKETEDIHLANTTCGFHDLKDMVVLAIHTARIYYVTDLVNGATADSPFEGSRESVSSYADYFKKQYGITLSYSGQALLRLKQSHNPHNLLSSNEDHKDGSLNKNGKSVSVSSTKGFQSHVHMPPELLVRLDVSRHIWKSLYLLPSLLHRMESIMLASQLRCEVCSHPSSCQIPVSLILEALTTKRCSEDFSMERLELLGDSVLKYVVSCNLFLKYPDKHEGQLSARRSWAVCNAMLHRLAISRKLQHYIRDAPFDPLRWLAPGHCTLRPVPCKCGVETSEVPLMHPTDVENSAIKIGVACDQGHRWLCSKTIPDCLEALIGAYYVSGGLKAARLFMTWVGIDAEHEEALPEQVMRNASAPSYDLKDIEFLESKLGYKFLNKGLLLEAITHPSKEDSLGCCYQRLEFLGDSVLDILITWYLFETHEDINEGELSDLRSASVNNEKFAQAAVKYNLHQHLRHDSGLLSEHITEYVNFVKGFAEDENIPAYNKLKGPKVLGDLVESIAGAILIDTKLDLGEVWRVFKPILSPFPTPEDLHLHPVRELSELCCETGFPLSIDHRKEGNQVVAKLTVQLKDGQLTAEGRDITKAIGLEQASLILLDAMEKKGISHKRSIWRGKGEEMLANCWAMAPSPEKEQVPLYVDQAQMKYSSAALSSPTTQHISIDMKKGGPRTTLYELCKAMCWVRPTFEPRASGSRFISKANLHVPHSDDIEAEGKEETDKRSSMDSAAVALLYKLGQLGKCIIK